MQETRLNRFYNIHALHYIGDVAEVDYNKNFSARMDEFIPVRPMFCDNIILWRAFDASTVVSDSIPDIQLHHNKVRSALRYIGVDVFSCSLLRWGVCQSYDIIPKSVHDVLAIGSNHYLPGYISFKVSLSGEIVRTLFSNLYWGISYLHSEYIFLHDIDITVDCQGNTSRDKMFSFLTSRGVDPDDIVDDRHNVGDNCISWYGVTLNNIKIKTKVYNKFVQMLESSDVRSYIGSRISEIVANPSKEMRKSMNECNAYGMTRVEIKVYSPYIFSVNEYRFLIEDTMNFLVGCPVYKVGFAHQWASLVDSIKGKTVVVLYVRNRGIFSYCHWYNSVTSKKQGCIKDNIAPDQISVLLSNYCFNNGDILLFDLEDTGTSYNILGTTRYVREDENITLVPGPRNSLFPRRRDMKNLSPASFDSAGLPGLHGVILEWPDNERDIMKGLSRMRIIKQDYKSTRDLEEIGRISNLEFHAAHKCLNQNTEYIVIAFKKGTFRSKPVIYAIVESSDSTRIKARFPGHFANIIPKSLSNHKFFIRTEKFITNIYGNVIDIEILHDF
jgi:hypothetical protein